jgi:magnesium-transporting ATPase (P-type)
VRFTTQPGDGPPSGFAQSYWFWWMIILFVSFAVYEIGSLATGHPENTLSNWIWNALKIHVGESITQWSAGDLLTFVVYIGVFVLWLPWHFWLMRFR